MHIQNQMEAQVRFRENGETEKKSAYSEIDASSTLLSFYHSICLMVTLQIKIYPEHLWLLSLPCNCILGITSPIAASAAIIRAN